MNRLGIEFISVLAMPPVEFIDLTASLGCGGIGLALAPFTANPHGYAPWSLRDDVALRGEVKAALRANGVGISLGEGFLVREGQDVNSFAADVDLMAELGAARLNILSIDADRARGIDQLGAFADMAAARSLPVTLEFMAGMAIGTLAGSADIVRAVGRPNFSVLVDLMHVARSGDGPAELAALDPALIGYVQVCDVPNKPLDASYGEEARHNRLALGEGDLPLLGLFAAIPAGVPVGLELPMLASAEAGVAPYDRLAPSVALAKELLG